MGTWKEDSIRHKYAELPSDPSYRKKSQKKRPKKADHKHQYKNCKIVYKFPDNWYIRDDNRWTSKLASYCPICGKISQPQKDDELKRLCPHVSFNYFFSSFYGASEQEIKDFNEYVEKHYPTFVIENYMSDFQSGQIFLDSEQLDSVR